MNKQSKYLAPFLIVCALLAINNRSDLLPAFIIIALVAYFLLRKSPDTSAQSLTIDIVGESNYQHNLARIAGTKTEESKSLQCVATLIPEPNNPKDPNAVRCDIDGLTVGYLNRDAAKRYKRTHSITVDVQIVGGWKNNKSEGSYGVKLLSDPL